MIILKCDNCGQIDAPFKRIRKYMYPDKEIMSPSGNGYEMSWKYTELCFGCLVCFIKKNPEIDIREYI